MTPTVSGRPLTAVEDTHEHLTHARSAEVLRIAFVRVGGGEVQGSLEPFTSPECNCRVSAVFRGRVRGAGDRIEGTFRTTDPNGCSGGRGVAGAEEIEPGARWCQGER